MKKVLLTVLLHVLAVAVPAMLAYLVWSLVGSESELFLGLLIAAGVAAEKMSRVLPQVPIKDWVNLK